MALVGETRFGGWALEGGRGGEVRVADQLADHKAACGVEDATDLAQRSTRVGDLAEHRGEDHGVDRGVLVRQGGGVAQSRNDVRETTLGGAARRVVEELLLEVEDLDLSCGAGPRGDVEGVVAGPRADLQHSLPLLGPEGRT